MQDRIGGVYDIGAHSVEYVIADDAGLKAYCSFKLKVTGENIHIISFMRWYCWYC